MSGISRTLRSLFYRVDQVVGEIENHDALIEAAIREQQKKLSAARVECNRITSQGEKVKAEIKDLAAKQSRWQERAVKEAESNQERALACVQQYENLGEQIQRLTEMEKQYGSANLKLREDIKRGETELLELKQKHQLMRARQSTADALGKFGNVGETRLDEVESSFDRWEVKISQGEMNAGETLIDAELDELERDYMAEETEVELKKKLEQLLIDNKKQAD